MSVAYVDTSVVVSIMFEENDFMGAWQLLKKSDTLVSDRLLISELYSVLRCEEVEFKKASALIDSFSYLEHIDLRDQLEEVLESGSIRGADCHHLAAALWTAGKHPSQLVFLTFDQKQSERAVSLGMQCPLHKW